MDLPEIWYAKWQYKCILHTKANKLVQESDSYVLASKVQSQVLLNNNYTFPLLGPSTIMTFDPTDLGITVSNILSFKPAVQYHHMTHETRKGKYHCNIWGLNEAKE